MEMLWFVRFSDGTYLGRRTIGAQLGPVPRVFAYSYDRRETAEDLAAKYGGEVTDKVF